MKKTAVFLLVLIILGNAYFRDLFHWVWLILGIGFVGFLIVFHWAEKSQNKKYMKKGDS